MNYVVTNELTEELGYTYAPEFRLVNLYVAGEYAGVYFLVEKLELDKNRIEIDSVYENAKMENISRIDSFEYCFWEDEDGSASRYFYNIDEKFYFVDLPGTSPTVCTTCWPICPCRRATSCRWRFPSSACALSRNPSPTPLRTPPAPCAL